MAARNKARTRAFQIIFEADQRGCDPNAVLADWLCHARTDPRQPPVTEYTMQLVAGYAEHASRIDELLSDYAVGWALDRMPVVDRSLLRLGVYELIWEDDVPDAVVLDEMVELAKEFSTAESPSFVNGLLGRLKSLKATLRYCDSSGAVHPGGTTPEPPGPRTPSASTAAADAPSRGKPE